MIRLAGIAFVGLALLGWAFYQLIVRRKKLSEIRHEFVFILLFIGLWASIYYWALH